MGGDGTNCLVGSPFDNTVESKSTWVEYWYGVEASTSDAETFRYDLESAIYDAAIANVAWCTGGRRVEEAGEEPYYVDELGRRLGIMAISSAPMDDVMVDINCPQTVFDGKENCFTMQGKLTVMSHSDDDLSMAMEYIRQEIKSAMENGAFLDSQGRGEASGLASVTQVSYLGNSKEEVLALTAKDDEVGDDEITEDGNSPTTTEDSNSPVTTEDNNSPAVAEDDNSPPIAEDDNSPAVSGGIKNVASVQNEDEDNDRLAPIAIGSVVGAACLMLLGILFVKRRKNRRKNQSSQKAIAPLEEDDDDHTFGSATIVSKEGSIEQTLAGGMAPPDENEVRAQALAAERQYAMEKGLGTIPEDATYYSDTRSMELVPADASHLGTCHSSIDVQPCQSQNCQQCREDGVVFIPRDWEPETDDSTEKAVA
mmetsp:Transcript_29439/g.53252  ORF Transcript_29439/g.53252 Transcript_29439/m.53252 type:complete len:425 (+) Transcript_29439:69-1343(+)